MKDEHGRRTATAGANFLDAFGGLNEKIDDGIRSSALREFEDWAMGVRDKLFEGHTSSSTDDTFMQALLATWVGAEILGRRRRQHETVRRLCDAAGLVGGRGARASYGRRRSAQ